MSLVCKRVGCALLMDAAMQTAGVITLCTRCFVSKGCWCCIWRAGFDREASRGNFEVEQTFERSNCAAK